MSDLVSMREISRRAGVTLRAIQAAVKRGRIAPVRTEKRGSKVFHYFDGDRAVAEFHESRDPGKKQTRSRGEQAAIDNGADPDQVDAEGIAASNEAAGLPTSGNAGRQVGTGGYQKARAAREAVSAQLARLKYEEQMGRLVNVSAVRIAIFNASRVARERLLSIPDRFASEIAASLAEIADKRQGSDQGIDVSIVETEVYKTLKAEIIAALEEVSENVSRVSNSPE